jgi:hypothetical protein
MRDSPLFISSALGEMTIPPSSSSSGSSSTRGHGCRGAHRPWCCSGAPEIHCRLLLWRSPAAEQRRGAGRAAGLRAGSTAICCSGGHLPGLSRS